MLDWLILPIPISLSTSSLPHSILPICPAQFPAGSSAPTRFPAEHLSGWYGSWSSADTQSPSAAASPSSSSRFEARWTPDQRLRPPSRQPEKNNTLFCCLIAAFLHFLLFLKNYKHFQLKLLSHPYLFVFAFRSPGPVDKDVHREPPILIVILHQRALDLDDHWRCGLHGGDARLLQPIGPSLAQHTFVEGEGHLKIIKLWGVKWNIIAINIY